MATTRLNQTHRAILQKLASDAVTCPAEQKARDRAYAKAARLVKDAAEKRFPPADMEVLQRYQVAKPDHCINGGSPEGRFVNFYFHETDAATPLMPTRSCSTRSIQFSAATVEAIDAYTLANDALSKALRTKLDAYTTLITSARTFEEVVEVWPAAEALRERIAAPSQAIVALSPEIAAFIRSDNARAAPHPEAVAA